MGWRQGYSNNGIDVMIASGISRMEDRRGFCGLVYYDRILGLVTELLYPE